jgi:hypothetical protein
MLVGLVALAGCAQGTDPGSASGPFLEDPVITDGQQYASAEIGPEGGGLDTHFGVSIAVPEGALREQTTIAAILDPVGPVYRFEPIGVIFEEAVLVNVAADDERDDLVVLALCFGSDELDDCVGIDPDDTLHPWSPRVADDADHPLSTEGVGPSSGSLGAPFID